MQPVALVPLLAVQVVLTVPVVVTVQVLLAAPVVLTVPVVLAAGLGRILSLAGRR